MELFPICYKINILNDQCWLLLFVTACLFTSLLLQVNFSYFEAGENKQALVKLVTCGRSVVFFYMPRFPILFLFPLSNYAVDLYQHFDVVVSFCSFYSICNPLVPFELHFTIENAASLLNCDLILWNIMSFTS